MLNPTLAIRELIATFWIAMDFCLIAIFGSYLYKKYTRGIGWKYWRSEPAVKAAIGLFTYFAGIVMTRIWGWTMLRAQMYDLPWWLVNSLYWLSLTGHAVALWGIMCMVRAFAESKHTWWRAALIAVAFVMATRLVDYALGAQAPR